MVELGSEDGGVGGSGDGDIRRDGEKDCDREVD